MKPKHGKLYKMTKREAKLLAHVVANFRDVRFTDEELAASIGWPVEEVRAAVETCAAFGLLDSPDSLLMAGMGVSMIGKPVTIDDLLTPAEKEEAMRVAPAAAAIGTTRAPDATAVRRGVVQDEVGAPREQIPGTPFLTEWDKPVDSAFAALLAEMAELVGYDVAELPLLVAEFEAGLLAHGRGSGDMRPIAASLRQVADRLAGTPKGAAFSGEIRRFVAIQEGTINALGAIASDLEAAGWVWKSEHGGYDYHPFVWWAAVREGRRDKAGTWRLDATTFLRSLHERLPDYCAKMLKAEGCPAELLPRIVERECHVIEDVLFGQEREHRPIAYPDMVPQMRRLVGALDALPGVCVTSWGHCDHDGRECHAKLGDLYKVDARILPEGAAVATRLRDSILEHSVDHAEYAVTVRRRDGRETVQLAGFGNPDEVAERVDRLSRTGERGAPDPEAAARRAAGWLVWRDNGWLTAAEMMRVIGIETGDEAVLDLAIRELEVDHVSASDQESLFNPMTLDRSIGAGTRKQLMEELRRRFTGRFQTRKSVSAKLAFATVLLERGKLSQERIVESCGMTQENARKLIRAVSAKSAVRPTNQGADAEAEVVHPAGWARRVERA